MARMHDEEIMNSIEARRLKDDAKVEAAIIKREDAADAMIGELCREGAVDAAAAEALAELRTFSPDVLILDVKLGDGHDGWLMAELAQQMFARMPLVVFATGSPERIPAEIGNLGMLAVKPYDAADLVEKIRLRLAAPKPAGWRALFTRTAKPD
jgi:DNA-binding response OmpR family regulator